MKKKFHYLWLLQACNKLIQSKWNDWTGYLPVYLCTCLPALIAHDQSLPPGLAAKASELAAQEWQRKGVEKATTKKRLGKARGQTRVNIDMAFQWWRTEGVKGLKSDAVSTNNSHVGCLRSLWKCLVSDDSDALRSSSQCSLVDLSSSSSSRNVKMTICSFNGNYVF